MTSDSPSPTVAAMLGETVSRHRPHRGAGPGHASQSRRMTAGSLTCVVSEADAISFVRARPRLFGIARRVLGSAADADDVVQDAWMRWLQADRSNVRDPAAFLATTTTRLALNVGQSARVRREIAFGSQVLEVADPEADPELGLEHRQAVELALRTVLETLSPGERAAYVLREAFDYPHRRIAEVLGLTEANARHPARIRNFRVPKADLRGAQRGHPEAAIVGEVLVGVIDADHESFRSVGPGWSPSCQADAAAASAWPTSWLRLTERARPGAAWPEGLASPRS